jgi:hypothetical protein
MGTVPYEFEYLKSYFSGHPDFDMFQFNLGLSKGDTSPQVGVQDLRLFEEHINFTTDPIDSDFARDKALAYEGWLTTGRYKSKKV